MAHPWRDPDIPPIGVDSTVEVVRSGFLSKRPDDVRGSSSLVQASMHHRPEFLIEPAASGLNRTGGLSERMPASHPASD